jgi:hypothetical protein
MLSAGQAAKKRFNAKAQRRKGKDRDRCINGWKMR